MKMDGYKKRSKIYRGHMHHAMRYAGVEDLIKVCTRWSWAILMIMVVIFSLSFNLCSHNDVTAKHSGLRGLRHELSSLAQTLGSWVRIPLKAWMSVCAFILFLCYSVCT
jgi:hypothetical protein